MNSQELTEAIKDSHLSQVFRSTLELILTVDKNYRHIIELEVLIKVLKSGLSDYYNEHHKLQHEITKFCGEIAENTRANHYRRGEEIMFDDVYKYLNTYYPERYVNLERGY